MNETRSTYTFVTRPHPRPIGNPVRTVEFGPYETHEEACEAFQRAYGYWPEPAVIVEPYETSATGIARAAWDTPMGRSMAQNND